MVHRTEKLTKKELEVKDVMMDRLARSPIPRKTKRPIIVALIGTVGSGKSSVSRELAPLIGATVVSGDDIRIELRNVGESYERARAIAEEAALTIVSGGGNAIIDSDFVDARKRASLREKARKADARVVFICTYCDLDVMIGRILTNDPGEFFNGASSSFDDASKRGVVVKLREMFRRLPHHYRWTENGGGKWKIRKPPCVVIADIDTTNPATWRDEVERCADALLK